MMVKVPSLIHVNCVVISQRGKRRWQVRLARHPSMVDQNRDHG